MNRKIAACFLAGILSITAVPVPAAAQEAVSGKNVSEEPLDAIRAQEIAMEKQEELEEEENMPAEEPDPLVLDEDGKVVPASAASWTEETQEPENAKTADAALPDDFSDGNPDGNTEEISDAPTDGDKPETEEESLETEEEGTGTLSENDEGTELVPEQNAMEDTQDEIQLEDGAENVTEGENTTGELSDNAEEETFTSEEADRFSDGSASEGELGTYQTVTLEIEDGQDITAPLNTLFLQLKEQVSDETPCKIIIPPGNYKLTGTLCMYSNMYLYAKGATITKTSPTKHLILRLGNTKESEGEYEGYRNVIIDGGTWDFNYQCVAEKDEPGGFVGFCIGHATNVTIKNATFLNNLKSHFLEFGGVKNAKITGCTFHGYYKNYVKGGQECIQIDCCTDEDNVFPQYMPYDGSTCEDFVIDGNVFEDVFAGVGTHSMMAGKTYKRITVTNNTFHNVKKRCIEFLNYEDSTAENNTMVNVGLGVEVSAVNKKNTHLTQGYSGEPDAKKNRNIRVAGNYVSLAKTSSIGGIAWICSGVKVIGYNMKNSGEVIPEGIYPVKGVTVKDNQISGYGNGISITLADTDTVMDNQVKMKKTSAYSNLGIYAEDSRGSIIKRNQVSGTANTGIYMKDSSYAAGSKQKNLISGNTVASPGGDGIYLQSVNATSTAEKNTSKSTTGSGIRVKSGKNISVLNNSCSSNKEHGVKIEYAQGGIRVKSNRLVSNGKSGILLWKSKATEVSGNTVAKNKGNGIYGYGSVISAMKSNAFSGNGKTQAVYMKGCKGWTNIDRPSCKKITAQSTSVTGSAAGGRNVIVYAQRSGKSIRLGYAAVNKKKQFTVKIKKKKKNTVLKIVSKDKYANTVTVNYTVK